jgi:hypothetical protein
VATEWQRRVATPQQIPEVGVAELLFCTAGEVRSGNMKFYWKEEAWRVLPLLGSLRTNSINQHEREHKRGTLASPSSFQPTTPHSSPVPTWNIYRQLEWKRQFSRGRPGMDSLRLCARWTHLNTSAASPTALSSNPQRNRTDASTTHDPDQYTIESKLTMFL